MEFSEEVVEPVTGYRVDMLLHGSGDGATGRCAVEVGVNKKGLSFISNRQRRKEGGMFFA